ncbi:HEPN domain-containing protein [Candidatus Pacearchaeota archaeon]|nr:HEPN domain-containing protein [Candidatus Pacearchaeota archaeon]
MKIDEFLLLEKLMTNMNSYAKLSEQNLEIGKKWLIIAKDDSQISRLLYKNKHYAGAAYHLQQAFEKLTKGYYILTGKKTPEEARDHQFVLNALKGEIKGDFVKDFVKLSGFLNNREFSLVPVENLLQNIEKSEDDLRKISRGEINKILEFILINENNILSKEIIKKVESKLKEKRRRGWIKQLLIKFTKSRIRDSDLELALSPEAISNQAYFMTLSVRLHLLSLLTFLHFNTPRYPYDKKSEVNFFDYTTRLGIVKSINKFLKIFDKIISTFEPEQTTKKKRKQNK